MMIEGVDEALRIIENKNKGTKRLIELNDTPKRLWRKKELEIRLRKRNKIRDAILFGAGHKGFIVIP